MALATAAFIALGGTGLGMQLKGQYTAGKAAEAQAASENAWRERNARLAERESKEALEAAAHEEAKFRKGGERLKATQRARIAALGLTFEGTPADVFEETATELEFDALMIRRGGLVGAQRFTAEAGLERRLGKSALLRGSAARRASRYGLAATAVGGASDILGTYGRYKGWKGF